MEPRPEQSQRLWSARRPAPRASGPAPPPTLPVPSIPSPVGPCPTAGTAEIHAQCTAPGAPRPAPGPCSPRDAIGGGSSRRAGFAPGYRRARAPGPARGLLVPLPCLVWIPQHPQTQGAKEAAGDSRVLAVAQGVGAHLLRVIQGQPVLHVGVREPQLPTKKQGIPQGSVGLQGQHGVLQLLRPGRGAPPPAHAPCCYCPRQIAHTTAPTAPGRAAACPPPAGPARRPGYRRVPPLGRCGPWYSPTPGRA